MYPLQAIFQIDYGVAHATPFFFPNFLSDYRSRYSDTATLTCCFNSNIRTILRHKKYGGGLFL